MPTGSAGVELLRVANGQGASVVARYLRKAVRDHVPHGCGSGTTPCPHEVEAAGVLGPGV
ncbi:hypothetical protein [Umezawaea sp.]|uniref:hypothetical protein n=1 Tax=Umezawaea sp. TaxID=1955258 RepID=UPI002ED133A3